MFFDAGIGILLSIATARILGMGITPLWVVVAIIFSLLPDIDIIVYEIKKFFLKKEIYDHRSLTHYPVIYLPIIFFLYFSLGASYSILFFLCIYSHLAHDTVFLGWGISWFWPLSTRKFRFFPDRDGRITSQVFMTWNNREESEIMKRYHNPHWVRDFYFRPNIVAYIEYTVFFVSLVVLYLTW